MNHVEGQGKTPPQRKSFTYDWSEDKPKNELKTPLFIFIKHCIREMTKENASRIERYVTNYWKTNANTIDKALIRHMFQTKLKSL